MTQVTRTIWVAAIFSVCLMAAPGFAQSLEIIELKHRSAEELLPALQPLVGSGGAVSGQDYKLFVRTTSANLAEIRRVVAQLDRAPRQLLVSVRNASRQQIEREGVEIAGTLSTNAARARVGVEDSNAERRVDGIASVAVLEGNAAMIDQGTSVPVVTAVAGGAGRRPWIAAQTGYREISSGFLVTPRVNGDLVILDVSQRAQALRNGAIDTQQLQTQVSGRLGEWLELGGSTESRTASQEGIGGRRLSTASDQRTTWIKVVQQ